MANRLLWRNRSVARRKDLCHHERVPPSVRRTVQCPYGVSGPSVKSPTVKCTLDDAGITRKPVCTLKTKLCQNGKDV